MKKPAQQRVAAHKKRKAANIVKDAVRFKDGKGKQRKEMKHAV